MTWRELLDIIEIVGVLVGFSVGAMVILLVVLWYASKPVVKGPQRIVDIENRGHTRIRMPDGTIR